MLVCGGAFDGLKATRIAMGITNDERIRDAGHRIESPRTAAALLSQIKRKCLLIKNYRREGW